MLDTFDGLPAHALVIHSVVVLAPLTAMLAVIHAVWPTRRRGLRLPVSLLAVATGVSGWVAGESGEALARRITSGRAPSAAIAAHMDAGHVLRWACVGYMVLVLVAVLWLLRPDARQRGLVTVVTAAVVVAASLALTWQTLATGHSGATAVWGGIV